MTQISHSQHKVHKTKLSSVKSSTGNTSCTASTAATAFCYFSFHPADDHVAQATRITANKTWEQKQCAAWPDDIIHRRHRNGGVSPFGDLRPPERTRMACIGLRSRQDAQVRYSLMTNTKYRSCSLNYGPRLVVDFFAATSIEGYQNGTIILGTT